MDALKNQKPLHQSFLEVGTWRCQGFCMQITAHKQVSSWILQGTYNIKCVKICPKHLDKTASIRNKTFLYLVWNYNNKTDKRDKAENELWASPHHYICHGREIMEPVLPSRWRISHLIYLVIEWTLWFSKPLERPFLYQPLEHGPSFAGHSHFPDPLFDAAYSTA